jgi:hypothetical protein
MPGAPAQKPAKDLFSSLTKPFKRFQVKAAAWLLLGTITPNHPAYLLGL